MCAANNIPHHTRTVLRTYGPRAQTRMYSRLLKHQAAPERPPEHGQKESLEGKEETFKSPPHASTFLEGCIHTPAEQKVAQVTTRTVQGEVEVLRGYMSPLKNRSCPLAALCLFGKKTNKQSRTSFSTLSSRTLSGMGAHMKITTARLCDCSGVEPLG